MSADDWRECPKGCKDGKTTEVMRVDYDYSIDEQGARFSITFDCQVCGLNVSLEQTKKAKYVVKEISFD